MPKYRVLHGSVKTGKGLYAKGDKRAPGKGDVLEMSEADAAAFPAGVLESLDGKPVGKPAHPSLPVNKPHKEGTLIKRELESPLGKKA